MLLLIMMSRQDLMLSIKFYWKVNSQWYLLSLWKGKQFLQCTTSGALMCRAWERAPNIFPKSGSARHCSPIPRLKLSSKLFTTLALYNKTTLHTAETWLTVTIIFLVRPEAIAWAAGLCFNADFLSARDLRSRCIGRLAWNFAWWSVLSRIW